MRKLVGLVAVLLLVLVAAIPGGKAHAASFHLLWSSDDPSTGFAAHPVSLGGFSDCNHNAGTASAYCGGLPTALNGIWWAYPSGWPDTANKENLTVKGTYEPQDTVWITGSTVSHPNGAMHIKMFNNASTGLNESAAVLPMKAYGLTYGKYVETWHVSTQAKGFKSAHLLWPSGSSNCCEEDFPEADWWHDSTHPNDVHAYNHHSDGSQTSFNAGVPFDSTWHTSTIKWTPGQVVFTLDGTVIGTATTSIPSTPEKWVIQNESEIDRVAYAAAGSSAEMDIDYVAVYNYS